ncbi:MAG: PQQ-dependent sugar dehydrogenase [Bacteroidota bacterium]
MHTRLLLLFLLSVSFIHAQLLPEFSLTFEPLVSSGLQRPVDVTHIPGDDSRLFIVEQPGRIRVYDMANEQLLSTPYLNVVTRVRDQGNEQGLLSVAFHPDFMNNGRFFINYTGNPAPDIPQGATVIEEYIISDPTANSGATSNGIYMVIDQPFGNHNGGCMRFGPDGYLYIGTGDGGQAGDPEDTAQDPQSLLGKMLRIDVDFVGGSIYGIPPDNPFSGGDTLREIWAMGMRNPWRFSFDRETGDLYIGDVGQDAREEINFEPADSPGGLDYGWDCREGDIAYSGFGSSSDDCDPGDEYVEPIASLVHDNVVSITGGLVYRGAEFPFMQGWYMCADLSRNWFLLKRDANGDWSQTQIEVDEVTTPVGFGEDANGEIYVADLSGTVHKIGAISTSSIDLVEGDPTQLTIFPNPAQEMLQIRLEDDRPAEVQIKIFDLQGKLVRSQAWTNAPANFQTDITPLDLSAGVYRLQLVRGNVSWTKQFVVR